MKIAKAWKNFSYKKNGNTYTFKALNSKAQKYLEKGNVFNVVKNSSTDEYYLTNDSIPFSMDFYANYDHEDRSFVSQEIFGEPYRVSPGGVWPETRTPEDLEFLVNYMCRIAEI